MGLDVVDMVMELEKAFNVSMEDVTLTTVGALFDHIRAQLPPDSLTLVRTYPWDEAWDRYVAVIEQTTDVPRDRLRPEATFRELGLG